MANIKQQKKRVRTQARERLENLRYRSTIKTLTKRLESAAAAGEDDRKKSLAAKIVARSSS
jgi:small subunit ribosomal protein S20